MFDMLKYHKKLRKCSITLVYSGPLWADGIGGFAHSLKKRLEFDNILLKTSQEVFSVFVEQMNNMLMYSAEKAQFSDDEIPSEAPKGTFVMGKTGNKYFIHTGNVMENKYVATIRDKINFLNTLDKKELRTYYKQQRFENDYPDSKGAGLGLIEIARRVSSKIECTFTPYDEGYTFFTLFATIGGDE